MTFWESLVYAMFHVMVIVMITGPVFAFIREMRANRRANRRLERQERIKRTRHNIYMLERELGLADPSEDPFALKPGQNVTAHK